MDRIDRIKIFQMVADHASFAEAARKLRIQPVAATRAVAALEEDLGVKLLQRTTRFVSLTEQGMEYLQRTRRILEELDDAARVVRGEDGSPRGSLVVTAPVLFGRVHVMPIITKLMLAYSDLSIRLILDDRIVRLAEEGIDVGIRIAHLPDSSLRAAAIATVCSVLVASPEYLAKHGTPQDPDELSNHALITFDSATLNAEARRRPGEGKRIPRFLTNSVDATLEAALCGVGIARVFSYHVSQHIAEGKLVHVLPQANSEAVPVSVIYRAGRQPSPNVRTFLAAVRAALPDCPAL